LESKELKNAKMEKFFHALFALLNFTPQHIDLRLQNIVLENVHLLPIQKIPKKRN